MHPPLVSIITIFLNAERFIEEAIESVLAQTYTHWELLLVDDGSTDTSTRIARRYAERFPERVRYLEHDGHQNRGMSASRNLGLRHARGRYEGFLDADDVFLPHKLAEQVALMETYPEAGMIYGRSKIWHSWTGKAEDAGRDHVIDLGVPPDTLVEPSTLFLLLLQNKAQTPTTCNALMRRATVEAVGGFEEKFRGMFEDQVFFTKMELKAPTYVAGACWANYRQHPESCCATAKRAGAGPGARLVLLRWIADYLTEQGIEDARIWEGLQRELWSYRYPRLARLRAMPVQASRKAHALVRSIARSLLPASS